MRWLERLHVVALALLVGAQCAVGYLVAPVLFALLPDRTTAGTIAGEIFSRLGWISLVVLPLLIVSHAMLDGGSPSGSRRAPGLPLERAGLFAMLVLTGIGHFWLRPAIVETRAAIQAGGGFAAADAGLRAHFGLLHGLSSSVFLLVSLIGIVLLARLRRRSG